MLGHSTKYQEQLSKFYQNGGVKPATHWFSDYQQASWENLSRIGLPSKKVESWKYLKTQDYIHQLMETKPCKASNLGVKNLAVECAAYLVIKNGRYVKEKSQVLDTNIEVLDLMSALDRVEVQKCFSFKNYNNSFALLNDISFLGGVFINIPSGVKIEKPIFLHFSYDKNTDDSSYIASKNVVYMGEGSSAKLFEFHEELSKNFNILDSCTKYLEANASLRNYSLANENIESTLFRLNDVLLNQKSNYFGVDYSRGSRLTRVEQNIRFLQEQATAKIHGLYVTKENRTLNHCVKLEHLVPNCESKQLFKGILNDSARLFFDGKVYVAPGADGTDSHQLNRNILLSDSCEVDTKPQLEIFADDVSCNHGASLGQLDNEELFYLMSRGISKEKAIAMLAQGFAEEVLNSISNSEVHQYFIDSFNRDTSNVSFEVI